MLRPIRAGDALEATVTHLATAIRLGALAHGELLPPERELATRLGVARVTLREAIAALREARMIQTRRGRGGGSVVVYDGVERVITRPDDGADAEAALPQGDELDGLLALRRILEPGAAALAASRHLASPQREALLEALDALQSLPSPPPSLPGQWAASPGCRRIAESRLHLTIAQLTDSAPVREAVVRTRGVVHRLLGAHALTESGTPAQAADHVRIVEAVLAGDSERARRLSERLCDRTAALLRGPLR